MATPFLSEIKIISFNFAPKGWALCNGQLLPINQNQALFSLLGTTYGGDGRVNFGLPNLQGRTPVGFNNGFVLGQIGGETAQMPGFYSDGEYDLAGFIVGVVEKEKIVTGAKIQIGDVLIGLPSTGLHTNGYSLARKLFFEVAGYKAEQYVNALKEKAGAALMKTHRSYLNVIKKLTASDYVTGMAHITGGGITENLPRILPKNISAIVELGSWPVLPIFEHLQELGNVPQEEMLRTFNLGIGLIAAVPADKFKRVKSLLERANEKFYVIGRTVKGDRKVIYQ